jgi:hypothetical protein
MFSDWMPAFGVLVALLGGWAVAELFYRFCHWFERIPMRRKGKRFDAAFLGFFERLLACALVAFSVPDTGTILAAWMGIKFLSNYHSPTSLKESEPEWKTRTFIALMTGTVSLACGVAGGLIARS